MLQLVSKACAVFVLLITLSLASVGQSTDRDNPTKLTSPEIAGFVDAQNAKIQYYYSFTAGPGEVVITLDVKAVGKGNSVSFEYEIFDQDAKKIVGDYGSSYDGKEDRRVQRFVLSRKTSLFLRIRPGLSQYDSGTFRLRLSGPVDVSGAFLPSCFPKQGVLRVKMKDGSIKEIDLKQAVEITIQP